MEYSNKDASAPYESFTVPLPFRKIVVEKRNESKSKRNNTVSILKGRISKAIKEKSSINHSYQNHN